MSWNTPIFDRLVAERGDVPAQVRDQAERIHRDMAQVMHHSALTTPARHPVPEGHLPLGPGDQHGPF
ncbi:hypothetical protein KUM39_09945 [Streptomyces sp. J2-1]|uniref:hypothetical protein n=1 Tax=Streptomyces corallincola TaxID=2851888 RepID=UPI001C37EBD6|nr:hypothetical protein [Streptomyces corallincola]MBV2354682.1 hypothetical protein [Streptomyces corallincola]